jgi:hypothetical protein
LEFIQFTPFFIYKNKFKIQEVVKNGEEKQNNFTCKGISEKLRTKRTSDNQIRLRKVQLCKSRIYLLRRKRHLSEKLAEISAKRKKLSQPLKLKTLIKI